MPTTTATTTAMVTGEIKTLVDTDKTQTAKKYKLEYVCFL